ncbi:MAG: hypothetical protein EBR88_01700 [Betaproteobacteria bacterium]|nr:hypothetical protein [Betaproteobacteria bacterium]NBX73182.1 hypothetical protein [Alphaproteobacteria bacterium]
MPSQNFLDYFFLHLFLLRLLENFVLIKQLNLLLLYFVFLDLYNQLGFQLLHFFGFDLHNLHMNL